MPVFLRSQIPLPLPQPIVVTASKDSVTESDKKALLRFSLWLQSNEIRLCEFAGEGVEPIYIGLKGLLQEYFNNSDIKEVLKRGRKKK